MHVSLMSFPRSYGRLYILTRVFLFKDNNGNTRKMCDICSICSKITKNQKNKDKNTERYHLQPSDVFMLTLNRFHTFLNVSILNLNYVNGDRGFLLKKRNLANCCLDCNQYLATVLKMYFNFRMFISY